MLNSGVGQLCGLRFEVHIGYDDGGEDDDYDGGFVPRDAAWVGVEGGVSDGKDGHGAHVWGAEIKVMLWGVITWLMDVVK